MKWFTQIHKDQNLIAAEKLAARLPDILLEAQNIAQTVQSGEHGRRKAGGGAHFWQYRNYDPLVDAASRIDWRQSARSDHLYVREQEEERAQTAVIWLDPSSAMHYSSAPDQYKTKYEYGFTMACVLGYLLTSAGERVKIAGIDTVAHHPKQMPRLADALLKSPPVPDFTGQRNAKIILISDFLNQDMIEVRKLARQVNQGQGQGQGMVLQSVDPAERDYRFDGHVKFETVDAARQFETRNAKALKADFAERFTAHCAEIRQIFGHSGVISLHSDKPLYEAAVKGANHLILS